MTVFAKPGARWIAVGALTFVLSACAEAPTESAKDTGLDPHCKGVAEVRAFDATQQGFVDDLVQREVKENVYADCLTNEARSGVLWEAGPRPRRGQIAESR